MKTQSAKVKAVAERLNRSAGGLVQWTVIGDPSAEYHQRLLQG